MTCKTSYELHHNFPKLADESGFTFNTHRPRIHIDWNKIKLIDIESLVRDRKFVLIEQHVHDILDCVLESEFDVRILDEGVLKMFRLAQLAVEYHQFCRHYLDRSVYVLREEINSMVQELNTAKSHIQEKEEEIRKLRKKSKYSYRAPMPYGNDNIATMILRTLSNKDLFTSSLANDQSQYNKCNYCEKVFMNQLYLKSHLTRRHADIAETPQKDTEENKKDEPSSNENDKLNNEVMDLKNKLKEMESLIMQYNHKSSDQDSRGNSKQAEERPVNSKELKDAEVSTSKDVIILDNIEEWKRAEQEKHDAELNLLKSHILETINSLREKDCHQQSASSIEPQIVEQLRATIKQQGSQINILKQELNNAKLNSMHDESENRRKLEEQMSFWVSKAENQSKQYEQLLQKLSDVAKEAQESRVLAEAEKQRANQLQTLLEQSLNNLQRPVKKDTHSDIKVHVHEDSDDMKRRRTEINIPKNKLAKSKSDTKTLEQLHRKAQELLNYESSSTSESSINITVKHDKQNLLDSQNIIIDQNNKTSRFTEKGIPEELSSSKNIVSKAKPPKIKMNRLRKSKLRKHLDKSPKQQNGPVNVTVASAPISPIKVVRSKITEEVNNRLVSLGVDPLKNRVPGNVFQKQRKQLQIVFEKKSKGFPVREKIRNSLIAHLDTKAGDLNKEEESAAPEYDSPSKPIKTSKLSSVLSNVKSKALSLVKSANDTNSRFQHKNISSDVAKRALTLLKTPPDSPVLSPVKTKLRKSYKTDKLLTSTFDSESNRRIHLNKHVIKTNEESEKYDSDLENSDIKHRADQNSFMDSKSSDSSESEIKENNEMSKSLDKLIKSPARRPSSASALATILDVEKKDNVLRASSVTNLFSENKTKNKLQLDKDSASEIESIRSESEKLNDQKAIQKQTKGVLKNASSTSSLNKKKVLFDMDAIQMKSVSASPSQSTEKSDDKDKFALGIINFDGDDWDISSIDDEPLKNDTKIQVLSRTGPKITELKEAIESQLARRNDTPTAPVGGIDVLKGPGIAKAASLGGSNTSLGSSILDESDGKTKTVNLKAYIKPKKVMEKEDSELDISEISLDGKHIKNDF